jgi:ribosome modulation factor
MMQVVKLPHFARREGMIAARQNIGRDSCPYHVGDFRLALWMEGWSEASGFNIPDKQLIDELLWGHGCKHQALKKILNHPDATEEIKRLAEMGMNNILPPRPKPYFPDLLPSEANVSPERQEG